MQTVKICLRGPREVQAFTEALAALEGDFDLISEGYILDARSLMGIFSLDLSAPVDLKVYKDTPATMRAIAPFLAE